jgi:hypothetical protein
LCRHERHGAAEQAERRRRTADNDRGAGKSQRRDIQPSCAGPTGTATTASNTCGADRPWSDANACDSVMMPCRCDGESRRS